jgi:acyl-CoA reductase-like NAD-dependent aldehyde dehydrogenase
LPPPRLPVAKTYKLAIGGKFPRSESGRRMPVHDTGSTLVAHVCLASRKDLRDAVEAARKALPAWRGATAYLRGQILYRMAEMMEGKRAELAHALSAVDNRPDADALAEVDAAVDRVVCVAGWTDQFQQILGCANPVAGPYHNFTIPEPVGVVGAIVRSERPLLALVSLVAPAAATGATVGAGADQVSPISACVLGEVVATSDLPGGVVNILTGSADELVPHLADHGDIDAIAAAGLDPALNRTLRIGVAGNLKRVAILDGCGDFSDADRFEGPGALEPFLEFKTMWHPASS